MNYSTMVRYNVRQKYVDVLMDAIRRLEYENARLVAFESLLYGDDPGLFNAARSAYAIGGESALYDLMEVTLEPR